MSHRNVLLAAIALPALLAGCGDGLEDRQAAVEAQMEERERMIEAVEEAAPPPTPAPAPTEEVTFSDDEEADDGDEDDAGDEMMVDAAPDDLIDNAQGFAPTPMDDAAGFDPTPMQPERFED